jgi:hypothetical protein
MWLKDCGKGPEQLAVSEIRLVRKQPEIVHGSDDAFEGRRSALKFPGNRFGLRETAHGATNTAIRSKSPRPAGSPMRPTPTLPLHRPARRAV